MALDVTYGNVTEEDAARMADSTDTMYRESGHHPGSTEPWITNLICALLKASGARRVLETGAFEGFTSFHLKDTLDRLGGGQLDL